MPAALPDQSTLIEDLRPKFLATLRDRQKLMQRFRDALAIDHEDEEALEAIRLLAHKMRGTSASYFYPALPDVAGVVEDMIRNKNGKIPDIISVTDELLKLCRKLQKPGVEY